MVPLVVAILALAVYPQLFLRRSEVTARQSIRAAALVAHPPSLGIPASATIPQPGAPGTVPAGAAPAGAAPAGAAPTGAAPAGAQGAGP